MLIDKIGITIAVDDVHDCSEMSAAFANDTAAVRLLQSAGCVVELVDTPLGTMILHSVKAGRADVCAVNLKYAYVVPE